MNKTRIYTTKGDTYKQIIYSVAMVPNEIDADGEYYTVSDVEDAAHDFVRRGGMGDIDLQHGKVNIPASVVESYIVRWDSDLFPKFAWVVGIHIVSEEHWNLVLSGEVNGLSVEVLVSPEPQVVHVEVPGVIEGVTTEMLGHVHRYELKYSDTAQFLGGCTIDGDHTHAITRGTATEVCDGHSHRLLNSGGLRLH